MQEDVFERPLIGRKRVRYPQLLGSDIITIRALIWIGIKYKDFSVPFSLSTVSETQQFVAREDKLRDIHEALSGDGSCHTVVLHGLGGIGKT
jgi:hypothetical protein